MENHGKRWENERYILENHENFLENLATVVDHSSCCLNGDMIGMMGISKNHVILSALLIHPRSSVMRFAQVSSPGMPGS